MKQMIEKSRTKHDIKKNNAGKYFYHISMAVLALTNSIFLIYNIKGWEVSIDPSSILLTFIGFFFAFGGMYVYSIFNANVDAEKKAINDLRERYEIELDQANKDMLSVRKLLSLYQIGQLIVSLPRFSTQHFAWVQQFGSLFKEQKDYLGTLFMNASPLYRSYKTDFTAVCRGISDSMRFLVERVENDQEAYFEGSGLSKVDRDTYLNQLKKLIADLLYDDYSIQSFDKLTDQDTQEKVPIYQRFKKALRIIVNGSEDK